MLFVLSPEMCERCYITVQLNSMISTTVNGSKAVMLVQSATAAIPSSAGLIHD